jgi:hypothetical protein
MSEDQFDITYKSYEEMGDKLADLPKRVRQMLNFSKPLGAANANPMSGGYASSKVVTDGDTAYNTAAKVYALYNALSAGATLRTWEFSVLPRYLIVWGSGLYGTINNQGYLTLGVFKAGTSVGVNQIALKVESYDKQRQVTVRSFSDAECNLGVNTSYATMTPTNNQTQMLALPQTTVIAAPYSRLAVDSTGVTVAADNDSYFHRFPVTIKSS